MAARHVLGRRHDGGHADRDAELRERVAAGFRELLPISPLAPFRDRFRYDDEAGRVYRSDGRTALAEWTKSR